MHYVIAIVVAAAVALGWSTIGDLLLGIPVTFFRRREKYRIRLRQRLTRMGQLRYILLAGVLRSGLAFALAMMTLDLLLDGSLHDWHREAVKFGFLSLLFGVFDGALGWDAAFSEKGPPVPPVR